ncbi:hypothetical protein CHISP_1817 [Chitinispirillum alkaliphilum]|nr:hypothetical protein CHISP_1817 [Chitinispirillum alkaliphilum]
MNRKMEENRSAARGIECLCKAFEYILITVSFEFPPSDSILHPCEEYPYCSA